MLRHACRRIQWVLGKTNGQEESGLREELDADAGALMAEYEVLWDARNRPGGFRESLERMKRMRNDYSAS